MFPDGALRKKGGSDPAAALQSDSRSQLIEYANNIVQQYPLVTAALISPDGSVEIIEDADAIESYRLKQVDAYERRKAKWAWQISVVGFLRRLFRKSQLSF